MPWQHQHRAARGRLDRTVYAERGARARAAGIAGTQMPGSRPSARAGAAHTTQRINASSSHTRGEATVASCVVYARRVAERLIRRFNIAVKTDDKARYRGAMEHTLKEQLIAPTKVSPPETNMQL